MLNTLFYHILLSMTCISLNLNHSSLCNSEAPIMWNLEVVCYFMAILIWSCFCTNIWNDIRCPKISFESLIIAERGFSIDETLLSMGKMFMHLEWCFRRVSSISTSTLIDFFSFLCWPIYNCCSYYFHLLLLEELLNFGLRRLKKDLKLWMQSFMGTLSMLTGAYVLFNSCFLLLNVFLKLFCESDLVVFISMQLFWF